MQCHAARQEVMRRRVRRLQAEMYISYWRYCGFCPLHKTADTAGSLKYVLDICKLIQRLVTMVTLPLLPTALRMLLEVGCHRPYSLSLFIAGNYILGQTSKTNV